MASPEYGPGEISIAAFIFHTCLAFEYRLSMLLLTKVKSVSEPKASTHTRAANIHTTHKGKMILPMGAAPKAPPPPVPSRVPFVCGVDVGGLLCGTSIESIESIKSIESREPVEPSDSVNIKSIESTQSIEPIFPFVWCECWRSFEWHEYRI